jgi:hypothetical protein
MIELCAGSVNGTVEVAFENLTPSDASRSIAGVETWSAP